MGRAKVLASRGLRATVGVLRNRRPDDCILPDILLPGFGKCGTTTLHDLLAHHPGVVRAARKEVNWGVNGWPEDVDWYRSQFPHRAEVRTLELLRRRRGVRTIDASTPYLVSGRVDALHRLVPHARYVVLVRDPVERAVSGYHHHRRAGRITEPIASALDVARVDPALADPARWREPADGGALASHPLLSANPPDTMRRRALHFLELGLYARDLARMFTVVPRDQVLVVALEDLQRERAATWQAVLDHVGLDPMPCPDRPARNVGDHDPASASTELRSRLAEFYRPWNRHLEQLVGRTMPWAD